MSVSVCEEILCPLLSTLVIVSSLFILSSIVQAWAVTWLRCRHLVSPPTSTCAEGWANCPADSPLPISPRSRGLSSVKVSTSVIMNSLCYCYHSYSKTIRFSGMISPSALWFAIRCVESNRSINFTLPSRFDGLTDSYGD